MSLVAAYSESENESESDQEENVSDQKPPQTLTLTEKDETMIEEGRTGFDIEDEDDWQTGDAPTTNSGETVIFSKLPEPAKEPKSTINMKVEEEEEDEFLKKKPSQEDKLFKKEQALLEKELNEKKKQRDKEDSKHFLSKFTKGGGGKKKVKISIPTLQEIGADSDSDDESNDQPKQQPQNFMASKKSSALFGMLPKPKNSVAVGANKNRVFQREVNRPLVPHTLSKQKSAVLSVKSTSTSKPSQPGVLNTEKSKTKTNIDSDDDTDDEEDVSSTGFFSFGNKNATEENDTSTSNDKNKDDVKIEISTQMEEEVSVSNEIINEVKRPPQDKTELNSKPEKTTNKSVKGNSYFSTLFKSKTNTQTTSKINKDNSKVLNVKDSPREPKVDALQTSYGITAPYGQTSSSGDSSVTAPYGSGNSAVTAPYGSYNNSSQQHGYPTNATDKTFFSYSHDSSTSTHQPQQSQAAPQPVDYYHQPNEDNEINQEAMRQLQGRKRRRGQEINLIDINAQDLQVDKDEYLKNLTMESGYKTKAPQDAGITGQQKKKHQITYLAFQAKEREFELRQSWADSRASKQQTQSKYGF